MSNRQRKLEKHRQRRREVQRKQQVVSARYERRLQSHELPLYCCRINANWQELGMASLIVARRVDAGLLSFAAFLVDRWAMGLKDAWGRTGVSISSFEERLGRRDENVPVASVDIATARQLVFGGIDLSKELGFRLPRHYERWTGILGPLRSGETIDRGLFRKDGRIIFVGQQSDLEQRLVGCTVEQFLSRPDVSYTVEVGRSYGPDSNGDLDDDAYLDDDDDDDDDTGAIELMVDKLQQRAREWCFAHGEAPHPLLGTAVEAHVRSAATAGHDVVSPTPDDENESFPAEAEYLYLNALAAILNDVGAPPEIDAAFAQLGRFMRNFASAAEFRDHLVPHA
ncbi:MAG: hypothetical protein HY763_06635 [Planctomycetes bacterium]|nr:hypothetical protein [Planctomycetota bacterium]